MRRMLASEARVAGTKMRSGTIGRDDWPKFAKAAGVLSELPIVADDTPGLTLRNCAERRGVSSQSEA